ncbi:hypothetical protein GUJ93_ZPchr0006g42537 [Zizania palustris]|uniref:Uncharacterized protein n=1 Tax=Zizania palustris TaxID=103762 RepID=A0A8J5T7D6_ZIZPA|nr:hypothetical protein GUJ93_ZPchr0006g42537 [Zizania palustris]
MAAIESSSLCLPWEILLVAAVVVATDVAAVTLLFKGSGDHGEKGQLVRAQLDLLDIDLGGWYSYNAQSAVDYAWELAQAVAVASRKDDSLLSLHLLQQNEATIQNEVVAASPGNPRRRGALSLTPPGRVPPQSLHVLRRTRSATTQCSAPQSTRRGVPLCAALAASPCNSSG